MDQELWLRLDEQVARLRANDTMPAAFLGDRTARRVRWLRTVEWGTPYCYEATCSACPDCGANFISAVAKLIPAGWPERTKRGRTHYDRRKRARCSICHAEREHQQKVKSDRRYRAKHSTPKSEQPCVHCRGMFKPKRSTARFCSTKCRVAAHRAAVGLGW